MVNAAERSQLAAILFLIVVKNSSLLLRKHNSKSQMFEVVSSRIKAVFH